MKEGLVFITVLALLTGCGGSSSSDKKDEIDVASYLPSKSIDNMYIKISDSSRNSAITENVTVDNNITTIKVDNKTVQIVTIKDEFILVNNMENNLTKVYKRLINEGSTLYTSSTGTVKNDIKFGDMIIGTKTTELSKKCDLESKIAGLNDYDFKYKGDILKFKCEEIKTVTTKVKENLPDYINLKNGQIREEYDISFFYLKKDMGLIADIDNDCTIEKDGKIVTDDTIVNCSTGTEKYSYKFLLE